MTRLLIGFALFLLSAEYYYVFGTTAAVIVLGSGTTLFLLALAHDERTRG